MYIHTNNNIAVGADIGGSHITVSLVDIENGKVIEESISKEIVNATGEKDQIITSWVKAIKGSLDLVPNGVKGIGIAMPGPFDYKNGISFIKDAAKYDALYGMNIRELLKKELNFSGDIYFENDASCFGLGENQAGEGRGCNRMIAITLGTGFGATFLADGKVLTEGEGVSPDGCLYNIPFEGGIAEDFISSRRLIKDFNTITGNNVTGVKEISDYAANGFEPALELFKSFGNTLGRIMWPWLAGFRAERLVIGGNIRRAHQYFLPAFQEILQQHSVNTEIRISANGEHSSIAGAAYLCKPN